MPSSTANDLVFAQFLDNENAALNSCYTEHKDLVEWISITKATIESSNTPSK